ncbi:putative alpha,alpha-trehalose-phosphate synthase [Dorcoceras hygrometricum]|uniref:Putative alpha,alpha-trehalose-phosphate synthase n=1 Tax=Dorcoceras hygrometricum TaxID=472368 RepID=A0A2Z7ATF9_9LAMI|nr:putative alpha,alpha-trehalose-phosphate synthase [Dorcoceras hygrometricum]
MAQYQILARKPLGPSGTGPKQTLEVKTAFATPPRSCRTASHRRLHSAERCACPCAQRVRAGWPPARSALAGGRKAPRNTVRDIRARSPASRFFPEDIESTSKSLEEEIQLAVGPQQLRPRNHNFGLTHRTMVKRLATSPHDPLGITASACKNQSVMVSVQYDPFNTYILIRSTTIGKSRVARDPITMHTYRRSKSDIACITRVSMTFRVVRTNQYNQDLGLIHSTNGNHLESSNEGSSIDHQVTIHLHAQNITMFPTNETWYFASQTLVSSSGGLILILTAQSTRNEFRIHSDY